MPGIVGSGPSALRSTESIPRSALRSRSVTIGSGAGPADRGGGSSRSRLPTFYSAGLMRSHWLSQQEERQSKGRASRPADDDSRVGMKWFEPPFDMDSLTALLFESVDFFAVVDQFATDVSGLGWDLVDAEEPVGPAAVPETGEVNREADADAIAVSQRRTGEEFLNGISEDFDRNRISIKTLCHCVDMDHESVGNGYIEVSRSRDEVLPNGKHKISGLFHVPGRLVRILIDGSGFVQLNDNGKEVAVFRNWGSREDLPSSRYDEREARAFEKEAGALKTELKWFKRYHSAEPHYGVPQVIAALVAVYGNIFSDSRNLRYFINRSVPDWLVTIKAELHNWNSEEFVQLVDEYIDEVTEHLKYMIEGDDHRTLFTKVPSDSMEVIWEKISPDMKDQDFQTYQTRNRDMVVRAYRMLPHRIGIIETASLGAGTGESQEETYKRAQVDPRQETFEEFFNEILDELGLELVRFKFREIDVMDEVAEMGLCTMAAATLTLTVNEIRNWLSRIAKDQDFPEYDDDRADIPVMFIQPDLAAGGFGFGPGVPTVEPYAAGEITAVPLPGQLAMRPTVDPRYANIHRRIQSLNARREEMRNRIMGRNGGTPSNADEPAGVGSGAGAGAPEAGNGSG